MAKRQVESKVKAKQPVKKATKPSKAESKAEETEIKVASSEGESDDENQSKEQSESDDSESDIELSEESGDEEEPVSKHSKGKDQDQDQEEGEEIKGLEDINKHVVIKPSKQVQITNKDKAKRGVIYLGRIPEGFTEKEMKQYFNQFGDITRVKLSRNKKTGKSKHYGFIEFENKAVAKIASETMNNYLLYGHLLKCYMVEDVSKYDLIFSNSKFRLIPWKTISRHRNDKPKSQDHWEKLSKKFNDTNQKRQKALKQKGIDLSYLA